MDAFGFFLLFVVCPIMYLALWAFVTMCSLKYDVTITELSWLAWILFPLTMAKIKLFPNCSYGIPGWIYDDINNSRDTIFYSVLYWVLMLVFMPIKLVWNAALLGIVVLYIWWKQWNLDPDPHDVSV